METKTDGLAAMETAGKPIAAFIVCAAVFVLCAFVCLFRFDLLKRPVFQQKIYFDGVSAAKYERDGNIYVIDSGSFRLSCISPEGKCRYIIRIEKMRGYFRFFDIAVDDSGNLYAYLMEAEYDAYLTKKDVIRKYDSQGRFVRDILTIDYEKGDLASDDNPRTFPQFGSLRYEYGALTFSRIRKDHVELYRYDAYHDKLDMKARYGSEIANFSLAQLALKDFDNFIYSTREGGIYEVINGAEPLVRARFTFTEEFGGKIPWYLDYDEAGGILFFDMISGLVYRVREEGAEPLVPETFFRDLEKSPGLVEFGYYQGRCAGVYGGGVWYYDGAAFKTYGEGAALPDTERMLVMLVQIFFVLGLCAFPLGIYLFFFKILDRYISIFIKQTAVLLPLVAAALFFVYIITSRYLNERLNNEILNQLKSQAVSAVLLIDGNDVESLKSTADFDNAIYRKLIAVLKRVTGGNRDDWNKANYAAMYKVLGDYQYWLLQSNEEANLFRPASRIEPDSREYDLITNGSIFASTIENMYGNWAYANVPVYTSTGKLAGIFEIGRDLTSYTIFNMNQRRTIVITVVLICGIMMMVLALILSIIVGQLSGVARVLGKIAGGDYSTRINYHSRDELGRVSTGLNKMTEELKEQFVKINNLKESSLRFVPVQFMEHLGVTDITRMKLGDYVQRNITVLFFDIRSFSVNSEMMTARENFIFINKVLSMAGPVIRRYNGFVDKFIGDAAMALFTDATDALKAGIALYRTLVLDQTTRVIIGGDGINIGVGINSGSVMMGIVGEEERLSSTVISPHVNLASRVEGLTKQTKSGILVTRNTMNEISGAEYFTYRFIGMVQAAGVNEIVGLFDILDALPEKIKKRRLATKKVFESGVRRYHTKDYPAARLRFLKVLSVDPDDVCARLCLAETEKRLAFPGLPSVFVFDKK